MGGNLNFGAHQLHFNVGGENNFYFRKDPYGLNICDHDGHVLITFGYGGIPTVYGNVPIATATKPAVYDLPLAAGCQRALPEPCEYRKSQEGRVYVTAWIVRTSGDFQEGDIVATLPEGYRPSTEIVRHADCANGGSPSGYCHAHIAPNGNISIAGVQQISNWLMLDFEFWAA